MKNRHASPAFRAARIAAIALMTAMATMVAANSAEAQSVPTAPRNLTATVNINADGVLAWDLPATTNGTITHYIIEYRESGSWTELVDTSSRPSALRATRSWTDSTTTVNVDRSYRVKAVNANGTGPASNVVTITPMFTPLKLVSATHNRDTIQLNLNTFIDQTIVPDKNAFRINVNGVSRAVMSIQYPAQAFQLSFTMKPTGVLRPGDRVTVSYRAPASSPATSGNGEELVEFSDFLVTNNLSNTAPAAPPDFRVTPGVAAGSMSLSWSEAWHNGSPISRYEVRIGTGSWTTVTGGAGARQYTATGLVLNTEYEFKVRAVNPLGNGAESIVKATVAESKLDFRLSMNLWGIHRGGGPTKVTLGFTGHHRAYPLTEPITFDLTWNGQPVNEAPLHADNPTSITIPAGRVQAKVELRAAADSDGADKVYNVRVNHPLVATSREGGVFSVENTDGLAVHDNEPEPVATLEAPELVEEGDDFRLTVRFGHRLDRDAAIGFGFSNPSRAKWNLTGVPNPQVITIPEGELVARTGLIRKPNNADKDGDTEITFVLDQPARDDPWNLGEHGRTVRINDDETPDTEYRRGPWLRTGPASARESGDGTDTTMTFRVNLDDHRSNKTPVTVDYRTVDRTARAGSDYLAASGTLTFAVGDKWKDLDVTVKDDSVDDDGETFEVRLENPTGGGRIHPDKGTATGTITNTEAAVLAATFPSSRFASASHSGSDDRPQVIAAFSEAVAAFDASTPSVAVAGGTVSSVQAHTEDGLEHAYIFFLSPSGRGDIRFTLVANQACAAGGICTAEGVRLTEAPRAHSIPGPGDGNAATLSELSVNDAQGGEGDGTLDFVVRLHPAAEDAVSVDYATADGSARAEGDYTATSGTLRFSAGETSKTVSVPILDDGIEENDETLTLTLSNAGNAELKDTTATGTIEDNDDAVEVPAGTPSVSIAGGSGTEGDDDEIDFTVTLDEAASTTVTVDYATSDGTAEAGDDYTATSGTLSFSAGTTSKTISVAIEDDIENESDETFTVTLSNPSGADLGTSTATGTIENRYVAPLTARFENMPSEHDGSEFTFELHFSESPEVPYRRLRDRSFTLVQADVTKAKRQNPQAANKNQSWTITVKPLGTGQIGITLPAAVSCTDDKSICTGDGRKLSHSTSATIAGPPSISVADATVTEAAGAVLAFTVSLSRSSGSNVTVDYATSDGTATAGADYTATSGTLTIGAGSTSGSIDVTVLDDSHDDGGETLTLTLSNASNGVLGDSTATGTIENNDPMPKALMARFGRTAAVHIVEQVEERVNAPRAPGFDGRIAGRQVNGNIGREFALDFLQQLGGGAGYTPMGTGQPMHARSGRTTNGTAMRHAGGAPVNGGGLTPMGASGMQPMQSPHTQPGGIGMSVSHGRLLTGSGFALNRMTKTGGILSFWSRSAQSQFQGREGVLALNGDVRTTMFGADYSKGRMVTGVSLSHSRGLGSYAGVDNGRVTSAVTGLYPWIGYKASERVTVWTVAGYGAGGLLLNPGAGTPVETGLSMAMAAGGGRGQILGGGEGFGLAFKADALWVGTRTDESNGPNGRLKGTSAAVNRLRTALEGSQSMEVGGRIALTPSVEVGIRQDGGDAETGTGMDVGAGLVFADAVTGLSVDVRIRTLVVHQAEGYAERGVSISVSYNPTPSTPLGFTARVSPAWGGEAMSGAEALWGRETMGGMGRNHLVGGGGNRLDTEVGYGLPVGARFVGTPRVGVATSEYGRDYRVGYGMQVLEQGRLNLELGIDAERRESPVFHLQEGSAGTDQRVLGRATVQW